MRGSVDLKLEALVRDLYSVVTQRLAPLLLTSLDRQMAAREAEHFLRESPSFAESLGDEEREVVVRRLASELAGCGPLDPLMDDPEVTDIMVNRWDRVYVARAGGIEPAEVRFWDEGHLYRIIERIARWGGRRIGPDQPVMDARMPDGSRAHAVLPPIAVDGACLTIRKFVRRFFSAEELVRAGTLTVEMAEFLKVLVEDRANILIAGAPGSGKTTLLNVLGSFIPVGERVVTIEDTAELQLPVGNCVRLESNPGRPDAPEVTIRDLLRAALRMRPDRIIVGEVRGPEALEMLQAMHAGHRGSYSTLHASSCRNALSRLEALVLQAGVEYTLRAIREVISQSVHVVVWMQQLPDGRRVVGEMSEVTGMEGDIIQLQPIFRYGAARGRHEWTGIVPVIWSKLREEHVIPPVFERLQGRRSGW
jgi:pilus assembly protein CpaF